jgi:hypothetical protein
MKLVEAEARHIELAREVALRTDSARRAAHRDWEEAAAHHSFAVQKQKPWARLLLRAERRVPSGLCLSQARYKKRECHSLGKFALPMAAVFHKLDKAFVLLSFLQV